MAKIAKTYKWGKCRECRQAMKLKPADREFCSAPCRYGFHNRTRGRITLETAREYLLEHTVWLPIAAQLGAGSQQKLRRMVRRGELEVVRLDKQVRLHKKDVVELVTQALQAELSSDSQEGEAAISVPLTSATLPQVEGPLYREDSQEVR